jgi:hypothetical protein
LPALPPQSTSKTYQFHNRHSKLAINISNSTVLELKTGFQQRKTENWFSVKVTGFGNSTGGLNIPLQRIKGNGAELTMVSPKTRPSNYLLQWSTIGNYSNSGNSKISIGKPQPHPK